MTTRLPGGDRPIMSKPALKLSFSHLGVFVKDLEKMRDFYTRVLGFVQTDRGVVRGHPIVFLSQNPDEHHQIVLVEGRSGSLSDKVINQISLRVDSLGDLRQLQAIVRREADVSDINTTDHGTAWSLYFRDPEGNRIELFVDSPWYVEQPRGYPLDLDLSDDEIKARTYAAIKDHATFRPYDAWKAQFAARLQKRMEPVDIG